MRLHPSLRSQSAGHTLVEIVISSLIAVVVLGFLAVAVLQGTIEQRQALSHTALEIEAGIVSDKIAGLLREMSVTESVIFADPLPSNPYCYRRIIVARGAAPSFPREVLSYNPTTLILTHDPNKNASGDERVLSRPGLANVMRELYFFPSFANDGSSDSTALNVCLQVDDNCYTGRRDGASRFRTNTVTRTFTVKMRNK
ncbi:MAG: hypothetical protein HZA90_13840 [Verrucomicrobia bacterium]|nr:hypothetical protein [Verrucomicrobiota bacterium]